MASHQPLESASGRHRIDDDDRRLLTEDVFRAVLIRERKRAERSGCPVALAVVSANARTDWGDVIGRLAAARDATDVMGWYETGTVIGVIRTSHRPPQVARSSDESASRFAGVLARQLEAHAGGRFLVHACAHPGPCDDGLPPVDPLIYPELSAQGLRVRFGAAAKRGLDVIVGLAALVTLAPIGAIVALLVKASSPGPVFFGQTRVGHMMKPFTMHKFRTMRIDADPTIHEDYVSRFIAGNVRDGAPSANGLFKIVNDPRVTRIGRFLRRTSLDELPQLWNVLRGDMSLVGPRPPMPYEVAHYHPWHRRRVLEAKPGITGLWQVTGRSRTTFDQMVRLDLRYARKQSLRVDLAILCRTPAAVVSGKGAC